MADANTGTGGTLRVNAWVSGTSAPGIYSDVAWELWLIERVPSVYGYNFAGVSASVVVNGGTVWSGSFTFDFRPGGAQSVLIASGTTRVYHNSDGTPPGVTVTGNMGSTGTSTVGGPTSVAQGVALSTLKVTPGTPTGVTAVRVSDTQATVSWSQSSASNGQPTTNTIQKSVNGGSWVDVVTISAATSATVVVAANQKTIFRVRGGNSAGNSVWSAASAAMYTTPDAPSSVTAAKNASLDIVVSFTSNVAYAEHEHEVWHGTVSGGVTTWDGSALATLASGTTSYTHTSPNAAQVHVYRVRAKAGALTSGYVVSGTVQLLAPPNAPTLTPGGGYAPVEVAWVVGWVHNPVDSTPQTAYEMQSSTNGGASWSTTGKVTSTTQSRTFAASTWAADVAVTVRVRTWGQHATASPWSTPRTVTFKNRPVASILTPAHGSEVGQAVLVVGVGFSQAQGASFVDAEIKLRQSGVTLETRTTNTLAGTTLATRVLDGGTYQVTVTVRDSNGLVSALVTSTFTVDYLPPVTADVTVTFLPDTGFAQIGLSIPSPAVGEAAAVRVFITRVIGGDAETVLASYPVSAELTILDTTPTVYGDNAYVVTTVSADDTEADADFTLTVTEPRRAYLSKGPGLAEVVVFGGDLRVEASPTVASALVSAAGRSRPIGLYATTGGLVVSGSSTLTPKLGSTPEQIEALLLMPGRACYRDPSGRRVFGMVEGKVSRLNARRGELTFTITETS